MSGSQVHAAEGSFELADRAEVVLWGTVEGMRKTTDGKLAVFSIRPERVLKGSADPGESLAVVQELLFATTEALFPAGARTLVFAAPLPGYTAYRDVLGDGTYLRWAERLDTNRDVASLADATLVEPVARYVAVRDDAEATARLLAPLLASPAPRLRNDALAAIEARRELVPLLDVELLGPLAAFIDDASVPSAVRAEPLMRLARVQARGILPIAEHIAAAGGPLEAVALDALIRLERVPAEPRLAAASRSRDPAVRIAAVRGLARTDSASALERLAAVARDDPSDDVRLATLAALGDARRARGVPVLAAALGEGDKTRANVAAESLGKIATPEAVTALGDALTRGNIDAQSAAAFALKRSGSNEALALLHDQGEHHPDPRVRRIIEIALGKDAHEH